MRVEGVEGLGMGGEGRMDGRGSHRDTHVMCVRLDVVYHTSLPEFLLLHCLG